MATTIALPLPPPPPLQAERTIAAAIAGHRATRDKILARGRSEAAIARQLDDALNNLSRIEAEFASFRVKAESRLDEWRKANERLTAELAQTRAKLATKSLPHPAPKRAAAPAAAERASAPVPAAAKERADRAAPAERKQLPPAPNALKRKPHEKELSVSKLEATAQADKPAPPAAAASQRFAKRTKSARPADGRWRPFTVSRSRSATCVTRTNLDRDDSGAAADRERRGGRASTGGLFKRSSLSFSRSNRSSRSSDRSRPASGMWGNCF